jgi:hypothetical protein
MLMNGFGKKQKVGRNDPCPCGSGKKFKKCHGGVTVSPIREEESPTRLIYTTGFSIVTGRRQKNGCWN